MSGLPEGSAEKPPLTPFSIPVDGALLDSVAYLAACNNRDPEQFARILFDIAVVEAAKDQLKRRDTETARLHLDIERLEAGSPMPDGGQAEEL